MRKLFLDIETLPAAGKDMEKIRSLYEKSRAKKDKASFEDYLRTTSLAGEFGRIFCIGFAKDDDPADSLCGEERDILKRFWGIAKDIDRFVGHNIMEFDLKFIYQRSIIMGVRPSRDLNFARYRCDPIYDTMKEWTKWSFNNTGLHKLCLALDVVSPKEKDIDGSKVYDYYLAGKTDEIVEYCKRDVEATRRVYKKLTFEN